MKSNSFQWLLAFVFLTVLGCASSDKDDSKTAEGAFAHAEKLNKQYRYEEAIQQFQLVRNQYPYSQLAVEAELRIADIQYERESYDEAQAAYQLFKDLHPKHPRSDYVTYRLAMSYFKELPETIDRDLTLADKAIMYFDEMIRSYPSSDFAKESLDKKTKCLEMLAEKELYIADFYFKREHYDSALGRYELLIGTYANSKFLKTALVGAIRSSWKTNDRTKAKKFFKALEAKFKDSTEYSSLNKEVGNELR